MMADEGIRYDRDGRMLVRDDLENRLLRIRWEIGKLEPLIRSDRETDPAREAIARLSWHAQQIEFKIERVFGARAQ